MYTMTFTVEGKGRFPIDMLRRDTCYPATEADAVLVQHSQGLRSNHMIWTIDIIKANQHKTGTYPTVGRWESFGWRVISIEGAKPINHNNEAIA